jgi:hypothetical protein
MSSSKSSGTCIAFRTLAPEQFHPATGRTVSAGNCISQAFPDTADPVIPNRFVEEFRLAGIDVSPEEFHELVVFDEFLEHHVQPNKIRDVQCMLLWNEWVRMFRRRTREFPRLIRENEFRHLITDTFGIEIAREDFRGNVYPGLRFVP